MPNPGIITGYSSWATRNVQPGDDIPPALLYKDTSVAAVAAEAGLGVFGTHPGSTAKYAFNHAGKTRDAEYRETMARLYIEMPNDAQRQAFLRTVSKDTLALAEVLTSTRGTGGSSGTGFIDFLMTNASEGFQEKTQIVDTLTDNYVVFYSGREPPLFSYSGVLLNTYQDDQRVWMWRLYQEIMRGSRLATRKLLLRLRYDSFIVSGYMEGLQMGISGDTEHTASQFQFSIRVKKMSVFTEALGLPTLVNESSPDASFTGVVPQQRQAASTHIEPPTARRVPAAQQLADLSAAQAASRRANAQAVLDRAQNTFLNGAPTGTEDSAEARLAGQLEAGNSTANATTPPELLQRTPAGYTQSTSRIVSINDGPI